MTKAVYTIALPSPGVPQKEVLRALERYTVMLYGVKEDCSSVNAARKHLFATENKPVALIP